MGGCMDEQLPTLRNFKAALAEPEPPEPWWKRYYSYVFFTVALSLIAMGKEAYDLYGDYGSNRSNWRYSYDAMTGTTTRATSEQIQSWIIMHLAIAGVVGFVLGTIGSIGFEMSVRKKRQRSSRSPE
jgi:hypothetical protein